MSTVDTKLVDPQSMFRLCHRSVGFRATEPVTDGRTLEGYAATFDSPTVIESWAGDFEEEIKRGAFAKTLDERMPVLQFDHGRDKRTGSVPIGAINDIHEDRQGLFVAARLFDNDVVKPVRQAIAGEAIRGMSFRFRVMRDRWLDKDGKEIPDDELAEELGRDPDDRGPIRREIREVELFELGPVVFPAYDSTSVGVRSLLAQFDIDERCARRNLALFSPQDRQVLARELVAVLPELDRYLESDGDEERVAVPSHDTGTVDRPWDAGTHVGRLPSPMPVATARRMYAWYDGERVEDGEIVKDACSLPHHEVSEDGSPGAANLPGCRNGLSRLSQSDIPQSDRDAVRRHLQNHLDAGNDGESDSAPPDAAEDGTSDEPPSRVAPAAGHPTDFIGTPPDWYLPNSNDDFHVGL